MLVENEKVVDDLAEGIHGCPILRMEAHGLKRMAQIYVEDVRIYFHYFNNGKKNGRYARHMVLKARTYSFISHNECVLSIMRYQSLISNCL